MKDYTEQLPDTLAMLQNLYTGLLWVDENLKVCWVNLQTEQQFSVSRTRLVGLNIINILLPVTSSSSKVGTHLSTSVTRSKQTDDEAQLYKQFADSKRLQQPFMEYSCHIKGAVHPLYVNYSVTPVDQSDKTYFLVEIWGKNHQSRIDKEHRLQEQHDVAREMLRSVAHEVKNPLAGIRGAAQLLIKETQRAKKKPKGAADETTVTTKTGVTIETTPHSLSLTDMSSKQPSNLSTTSASGYLSSHNPSIKNTDLNDTDINDTDINNHNSSSGDSHNSSHSSESNNANAYTETNLDYGMMLVDAKKLTTYAGIVISETDRLASLIEQLLGSNQLPNWESVNIHEPLEHVLMLAQSQHPDIHIVRDYDLSLPNLTADKNQLIQVFLNLVNNACDAMLEQDFSQRETDYLPTLHLITRIEHQYTIGSAYHRQALKVCIHDNGAGIDPELIERIFFPLVTGRANGTGLGLALVQEMVHRHHGAIEVSSEVGNTAFCVYLPFEQKDSI